MTRLKYVLYCPKCKKPVPVLYELRGELVKHLVTPDLSYEESINIKTSALLLKCGTCNQIISEGKYAAHDFLIGYDEETGKIVEHGSYFSDYPEELPEAIKPERNHGP